MKKIANILGGISIGIAVLSSTSYSMQEQNADPVKNLERNLNANIEALKIILDNSLIDGNAIGAIEEAKNIGGQYVKALKSKLLDANTEEKEELKSLAITLANLIKEVNARVDGATNDMIAKYTPQPNQKEKEVNARVDGATKQEQKEKEVNKSGPNIDPTSEMEKCFAESDSCMTKAQELIEQSLDVMEKYGENSPEYKEILQNIELHRIQSAKAFEDGKRYFELAQSLK